MGLLPASPFLLFKLSDPVEDILVACLHMLVSTLGDDLVNLSRPLPLVFYLLYPTSVQLVEPCSMCTSPNCRLWSMFMDMGSGNRIDADAVGDCQQRRMMVNKQRLGVRYIAAGNISGFEDISVG